MARKFKLSLDNQEQVVSGKIKLKIGFDKQASTVATHIRWFTYLTSDQLLAVINRRLKDNGRVSRLLGAARGIVERKVYAAYPDPGTRSGDLLKSVSASYREKGGGYVGGWNLYMDPSKAQATAGGLKDQAFNYAAFFLDPAGLHTFITVDGVRGKKSAPKTFRDFFGVQDTNDTFKDLMVTFSRENTHKAIVEAIAFRQPKFKE